MDPLTTANLNSSSAVQTGNAGSHPVNSKHSALTFPSVLDNQLTDLEEGLDESAVFGQALDIAGSDAGDLPNELHKAPAITTKILDEAANINRPPLELVGAGGNTVPIHDEIAKDIARSSHPQSFSAHVSADNRPRPANFSLELRSYTQQGGASGFRPNQELNHQTAKLIAGSQADISSSAPILNASSVLSKYASAVSELDHLAENANSRSAANGMATASLDKNPSGLKALGFTGKADRLNDMSALLATGNVPLKTLASTGEQSESVRLPINLPHADRTGAHPSFGAAKGESPNLVIKPEKNFAYPSTTALVADGAVEQTTIERTTARPLSLFQHEQGLKLSISSSGVVDNNLNLELMAKNSPRPDHINALPPSTNILFDKVPVTPTSVEGAANTIASGETNHVLQGESLGFGSAQQPIQPGALPKSGHSQYLGVAQFNDPQFSRNLNDQVLMMAGQGVHKAHISLNPHELGPLEIRLSVIDDEVSVQLISGNPAVRESIEQAVPRLRELFGEAGLKLGQHDVSSGFAEGKPFDFADADKQQTTNNRAQIELEQDAPLILPNDAAATAIDTYI